MKQNLVRDVRKITKLSKQVLWEGTVRAVVRDKKQNGKLVQRAAKAVFFFIIRTNSQNGVPGHVGYSRR